MTGTLTSLLFVEITITVAAIALFMWLRFLDMKEDDHLVLNPAEAHLDREQAVIRKKVAVLNKYMRVVGVAWGVVGVVLLGVWVVQGLS